MSSNFKDYNETVDYLYNLQKHGIKLGLSNIERLMKLLGEPHKSFHSIHVAGTNGKGSTSAIVASILKESSFKVGLYTSPHLVNFTERIRINNIPIMESEIIELASYIRNITVNAGIKPTFFEFVTAMAFYYFAQEKIDWAVIEVGMGGRLDATNVINPKTSIITTIGFEHKEFLGESISEIASEKAGIIKNSIPVVTATDNLEALDVLKKTAKRLDSEIHVYGKDFRAILSFMDDKHIVFDYISNYIDGYKALNNLLLPLTGKHQLYNASLAIRACEILMRSGFAISEDIVISGLQKLKFEGRFECASHIPPIIIDGAHNPDAARALAQTIEEVFLKQKKIILVIGIMKDKEIKGILYPLSKVSDTIILTKPTGQRSASPEILKECLLSFPHEFLDEKLLLSTNTVKEAIEQAKMLCRDNCIILITGSFYTAGEAKEFLGQRGVFSNLRE